MTVASVDDELTPVVVIWRFQARLAIRFDGSGVVVMVFAGMTSREFSTRGTMNVSFALEVVVLFEGFTFHRLPITCLFRRNGATLASFLSTNCADSFLLFLNLISTCLRVAMSPFDGQHGLLPGQGR